MLDKYLLVAEGLKPQGLDGTLKIRVYMDDADDIMALNSLCLKEKEQYTPVAVENVSVRDGFAFLKLQHIDSRESAEKLRGTLFYMLREDAPALPEGRYYICDLIGCAVTDTLGNSIGTVEDVLQPGANDVYVVKGARGEVLLPVIPQLIHETDVEKRSIIVDAKVLSEVAVFED